MSREGERRKGETVRMSNSLNLSDIGNWEVGQDLGGAERHWVNTIKNLVHGGARL